jgi:hypothetical protein
MSLKNAVQIFQKNEKFLGNAKTLHVLRIFLAFCVLPISYLARNNSILASVKAEI